MDRITEVAERRRVILSALPPEFRLIARQEATYLMNTAPGWRPSDALARAVQHVQAGHLDSPVAAAHLERVRDM